MRILHTADFHADANLKEFIKCSDFLTSKAREENPDLIIIAGDVFEDRNIKVDSEAYKTVVRVVYSLSEIAPLAIVTGTPLHEGHATESLIYSSAFEHNIIVSSNPEQLYLKDGQLYRKFDLASPDAIISMMPTPTKQFMQGTDDQISQALTPIFAGFGATALEYNCPHIGVYHGTVRGGQLANNAQMIGRDIEITKDQIALANFDILCCGHLHLPQQIEISPNLFACYSGSLGALNYGEDHDHGFYIHENVAIGDDDIKGERFYFKSQFIKTPSRKLVNVGRDLTGDDGMKGFDAALNSVSPDEINCGSVKISLKLWQDEVLPLTNQEIEAHYKKLGASEVKFDIKRVPREVVRSERVVQLESLGDKMEEQAKIKSEILPDGIKEIAADLETLSEDEIYAKVTDGYTYGAGTGISPT